LALLKSLVVYLVDFLMYVLKDGVDLILLFRLSRYLFRR